MGDSYEQKNGVLLRRGFQMSLVLVVLLEFVLVRREHLELSLQHIAEVPVFHAVFGFAACVLIVLVTGFIRLWLNKEEDYYD